MPNPTVDQVAPGGVVDLSKAPAGLDEATFDQLFPADGTTQVTAPVAQTPQTAPVQQTQPGTQTAPVTDAAPFIKANTSVYKTPEAAIEGINQKDALIEQLRQRYALTTGIDPITGQPVAQAQPTQPSSYFDNPKQYLDDLYTAAKEGGPQAYRDVQAKFLLDTLAPAMPLLQRAAREQAVETVAKEVKDIGSFIGTPAYQNALEANPELKSAIAAAESDFRWHSRLPGLYKIAYFAGQGLQLPELLKAQATQTQQSQTPPVQPRPTLQATTPSIPQATTPPSFRSIDGIKAIVKDLEARGAKLEF